MFDEKESIDPLAEGTAIDEADSATSWTKADAVDTALRTAVLAFCVASSTSDSAVPVEPRTKEEALSDASCTLDEISNAADSATFVVP